jgi:hypothetical protein
MKHAKKSGSSSYVSLAREMHQPTLLRKTRSQPVRTYMKPLHIGIKEQGHGY